MRRGFLLLRFCVGVTTHTPRPTAPHASTAVRLTHRHPTRTRNNLQRRRGYSIRDWNRKTPNPRLGAAREECAATQCPPPPPCKGRQKRPLRRPPPPNGPSCSAPHPRKTGGQNTTTYTGTPDGAITHQTRLHPPRRRSPWARRSRGAMAPLEGAFLGGSRRWSRRDAPACAAAGAVRAEAVAHPRPAAAPPSGPGTSTVARPSKD